MSIEKSIKRIPFNEAVKRIQDYKYALIYEISSKFFGEVESLLEFHEDEFVSAYFFSEAGQLHIYQSETGLDAVVFEEESSLIYMDKQYELAPKHKAMGTSITVREYLDKDEDGQNYIAYTRLVAVR